MKKYLHITIALFIASIIITSCSRNEPSQPNLNNKDHQVATAGTNGNLVTSVALITQLKNGDIEYLFTERQAIYTVSPTNPQFEAILKTAREALANKKPVKLISDVPEQIIQLNWPSIEETKIYLDWYRLNINNAELTRAINVSTIDTLKFNLERVQNWRVFRLCTKVIPDINTAQQIFDFCKQQACTFGPTQITPCIPFQYVKDGCFARAHKMRYIIEQRYGYCSEKVFSYGNLDVKASMVGGCCVGWWYHVAPLIRVKINGTNYCCVIDPSMFTAPVLLSTWLAAQGNTTCDATSQLTNYSIQPSTTYTPASYIPVSTYTTDAYYSITNTDLQFYNTQGTTCNN